ncbi:hypothetical protein B2_39 [Stenotrophomonas phage B2]|nr:hypothetical protein B2_39 [Stenotrophomonas phage B2]
MTHDVSANGVSLRILASVTFPQGFTVTEFADDADPFDVPEITVAEPTMNVNGDLIVSSAPQPLVMTINVIPGGDDDNNLAVLLEANRAGKNKRTARDEITIVASYPDGSTATVTQGKITGGVLVSSPASAGRIKSKPYTFAFGDVSRTRG